MTIKDFKYKLIKNFLTTEEIKLLVDYCRIKHRLNFESFDFVQNSHLFPELRFGQNLVFGKNSNGINLRFFVCFCWLSTSSNQKLSNLLYHRLIGVSLYHFNQIF